MVPLEYLSSFQRTLEIPLINCEINQILNQATTFAITDTELYVPVVTLSTQDNAKLFQQLKSSFKRTINWNKYQSKVSIKKNQYLDYLTDPSFQGVNRLFVLLFENNNDRTAYTSYFLPTVEIKNQNVMVNEKNLFDQPAKFYL